MLYIYDIANHDESLIDFFGTEKIKLKAKVQQDNEEILNTVEKPGYFIFHVDLTNTTKFYTDKQKLIRELLNKNVKPVNGFIEDISKTYIQNCCQFLSINNVVTNIKSDEDVIIKSNLNFNNLPEIKLTREEKNKLDIPFNIQIQPYKIMKYADVDRENLPLNSVIERFIENDENLFYRVYKFYSYYVISEMKDSNKIKKTPEGIKRTSYCFNTEENIYKETRFCSILEQTKKLSAFIHLDYGTFDVVKSNKNQFYIIDVNTTPFWGTGNSSDLNEIIQHLQAKFL